MMALTTSPGSPWKLQHNSVLQSTDREKKSTDKELQTHKTQNADNFKARSEEINHLLSELIQLKRKLQQQSQPREQLLELYQQKRLEVRGKLIQLESSSDLYRKENKAELQNLKQKLAYLLETEQQEAVDQKAIGNIEALSLPGSVKKAWFRQQSAFNTTNMPAQTAPVTSKALPQIAHILPFTAEQVAANNPKPQALLNAAQQEIKPAVVAVRRTQQSDMAPVEDIVDPKVLQQLEDQLVNLGTAFGKSWQSMLDKAQQAVITVLLNNPLMLKQDASQQPLSKTAEQPQLTPPRNVVRITIEQMLLALRLISKETAAGRIDTEAHTAQALREHMLQMSTKKLKEHAALQDKARSEQQSAERRGKLFKWLMRIVAAVVGTLVSVFTAGIGAMLFSLAFMALEIILEETVGFSLMGKIAEGLGKGFSAAMKAMGATGEWVEYVAIALAQIIIMVASIAVTMGVTKLSNTQIVQKLLATLKSKAGIFKGLIGAPDPAKLIKPLKVLANNRALIQVAGGLFSPAVQAVEVYHSVQRAKTKRALGDNQVELTEFDFLANLLSQMIRNMPKAVEQSAQIMRILAELASELRSQTDLRQRMMTMNFAQVAR